jgi:hypothetical protein
VSFKIDRAVIFFSKTRENIIKDFRNFDISKWVIISGILIFLVIIFFSEVA